MVITLTKQNTEEVLGGSKPVVIDVYATWCGPCQMMKPHFEAVAQELGDQYSFAQLNVDEARDLAVKYGVTSVPTIIFLDKNEVKGKVTGFRTKEVLKEEIKKYLG
jgi:thioredoxin 1